MVSMSLTEWVPVWLADGKSPDTQKVYKGRFDQFVGFVEKPLEDVVQDDFRRYYKQLLDSGDSENTVHGKIAAPRSFWRWLYLNDIIEEDVFKNFVVVRQVDGDTKPLTQAETVGLLSATSDSRDFGIVSIMVVAGLGCSEVARLRVRNVRIQPQGVCVHSSPNCHAPVRKVWLPRWYRPVITKSVWHKSPDEPLYPSPRGAGFLSRATIYRIVRKAADRAGIRRPVGPRVLRATHASLLIDNGASLYAVADSLGLIRVESAIRHFGRKERGRVHVRNVL